MEYFLIFISAIFVNNIVLSQFLGICPFLGVSKKVGTAAGMGIAVTFVLTVSVIVTYALQIWVLNPYGLDYLQTILFRKFPLHRRAHRIQSPERQLSENPLKDFR